MTKYITSILAAVLFFYFTPAQAAISPVSISVAPPVQFPPNDFAITGVRASALWGKHRNVYGIDVGLLGNITEQTFTGLAVSGLFNRTMGTTTITGLQLAGLTNINTSKTRVFGLQAALGANINTAESSVAGLQLALANISDHTSIYGVQAGLYNKAKEVYGFQIGLINVTDNLHGIQIGLVNFNKSGPFAISPVLNVGF
ncbi:hypothetical protein D3C72_1206240 [compost metagenome]